MLSQPESPNSLSQLAENMFPDNNSAILLAAIVSLLLVILFVLLLHVYAKWFLFPAQPPRRRRTPATFSGHNIINIMEESPSPNLTKGLDATIVSKIPLFVGKTEELECVICLSEIEEGEIGRTLPKCGHAFHVECIDMWLSYHCNCPICRAPIVNIVLNDDSQLGSVNHDNEGSDDGDDDDVEVVVVTPGYEISESEESYGNSGVSDDSVSESLVFLFVKRMLSKVFVSSYDVNELHGS